MISENCYLIPKAIKDQLIDESKKYVLIANEITEDEQ